MKGALALLSTVMVVASATQPGLGGAEALPVGSAPAPLAAPHFPDSLHTFVWRNWESANLEQMAAILGTTPDKIGEIGVAMGLPKHQPVTDEQWQRGYISLIRRNWHLLPYDQLLALLGWNADQLAYTLREDDFLWHKLGALKPACPPLRYAPPREAARARCDAIKAIVESQFGAELAKPGQPRFAFVHQLSALPESGAPKTTAATDEPIRFLYAYFAVYGDPLLKPELDPYPDGLLARLAELGVNGVWMHTVLRQLAPSETFPEFGADHQVRLANLRKLVERAGRHGIKVYLYMNEPRAMPVSFFERHADCKGAQEGDYIAMCTSVPQVRQWITGALGYVFKEVPGLGGVFTITASENLTNCHSHYGAAQCPRCAKRPGPEVVAEINTTIADGVRQGQPDAKVIVWDWGWKDEWAEPLIKALPDGVYLMSVSEWSKPIVQGGVASEVGEYSISAVGPGPRALRHWALARQRGLKTIAKVQVNCTWELSAVPYLPVMDLVAQHCANLAAQDLDGLMLSWTLGGYPSPNLQVVKESAARPAPSVDAVLQRVAVSRYGPAAAADVRQAWTKFSTAFAEYPYHGSSLYAAPTQWGPANLFYTEPTGYKATMVGYPYDDVESWRSIYPADVFAGQFAKVAEGFKAGLASLRSAVDKAATPTQRDNILADLRVAEGAYLHLQSVANQVRFTLARDALRAEGLKPQQRTAHLATIKAIAAEEIGIAKRLFVLTREDSRIGFEASNHYYYYPLDLVEKVINCQYILNEWIGRQQAGN